jgi:ubiquinone/menaquinone biosynthesis C-methylase UbiE
MKTEYNLEQIVNNEKGWLFYDAAFKGWKEMFTHIKGESVLDLGCASGISMGLIKLFSPKTKVVGLEGSKSGEEAWKARGLDVVDGDIYSLPFKDNEFDTVYSSHVLEHLVEPEKALLESIRVAKKRVIHIVPDGNVDDKNFGSPHLHNFNRMTFEELFEDKGLTKVAYKSITDSHINSLIAVYEV